MPDETRRRLMKTFTRAGIIEGYGMTETCGITTVRQKEYTDSKPYSVGLTPSIIQVRVVDEQGDEVAPNEIGEIIVRGPNVMKEYYKDPEKTAEALRDGWLWTHDLGRRDKEGFLYIIERKNDMIKSGGENIYPKEVEDILYRHPKIAEAAVFGVRDPVWGQNVFAAVVLKNGAKMRSEEVIQYCKENLASFKKPKHVEFVDSLPRSPIGKVLRSELRKRFESK
jgi:acyl-CoA synthetase (AMP-forming)/AMP-acid ligase II